jgi:hypothetical protein
LATYVVATKREARDEGITAEERVRGVAGATVTGSGNADRVVVEMSPEAALELQRRFGEKLFVEPLISHDRLSSREQ